MKKDLRHLDEFARHLTRKQARKLYESKFSKKYNPKYIDEFYGEDFDNEYHDFEERENDPDRIVRDAEKDDPAIEKIKKYNKEQDIEALNQDIDISDYISDDEEENYDNYII
jgi:hypothetical protein